MQHSHILKITDQCIVIFTHPELIHNCVCVIILVLYRSHKSFMHKNSCVVQLSSCVQYILAVFLLISYSTSRDQALTRDSWSLLLSRLNSPKSLSFCSWEELFQPSDHFSCCALDTHGCFILFELEQRNCWPYLCCRHNRSSKIF